MPPMIVAAGVIDIGQIFSDTLQPYVNGLVNAAILALVGFVATWLKAKWNIEIDASYRDTLTQFLEKQASALIAKGAVKLDGVKVNVQNDALAAVANEALHRIPDVLSYFKLTPEMLQARIVAALPKQPAVAQATAVALDVQNPQTPGPDTSPKPII